MEITQLIQVIAESSEFSNENPIERSYFNQLRETLNFISPLKVLTGLRRSGKSFLLKQLFSYLIKNDLPKQNLLFLNFENDQLKPYLSLTGIREIYNLFLRHVVPEKPIYLFFDEIQNIPEWESFVRTLYDTGKFNIYITGSNSSLLSSEFSSALGGRILEFYIQPFSFKEYLVYHGIKDFDPYKLAELDQELLMHFEKYLVNGGLVETFKLTKSLVLSYKDSLIEKIIIQDILKRYKLEKPELLRDHISYFQKAIGTIVSIRNLSRHSHSSEETVANYLGYLINSFLLIEIKKYAYKTHSFLDTQKKCYFIDNIFTIYADPSQQLENCVLTELVRTYGSKNIFFGRDEKGHEIDFVVQVPNGKGKAIQVCYELNEDNFDREIRSLLLMRKYDRKQEFEYVVVCKSKRLNLKTLPEDIKLIEGKNFCLNNLFSVEGEQRGDVRASFDFYKK